MTVSARASVACLVLSACGAGRSSLPPAWTPPSPGNCVVAFDSPASNLVPGDEFNTVDVFIRDTASGKTMRITTASLREGELGSGDATLSGDGRHVAFDSESSDLVPSDTNGVDDVFVHDRLSSITTRISLGMGGREAGGDSGHAVISADGRFVAFASSSSSLVLGDKNEQGDVFVHDRQTQATSRVSVGALGREANESSSAPSISADGRYVAFMSLATNLVADDTNGSEDIFVHDRTTAETTRVSISGSGHQGNGDSRAPEISGDGRYVVFTSVASNLDPQDGNSDWDVFVHDRAVGTTMMLPVASRAEQGKEESSVEAISADGRFIAFDSSSEDRVSGEYIYVRHVFVHDLQSGRTTLASADEQGIAGNAVSFGEALSQDGRFVVFNSDASNLVEGDSNGQSDVFLKDLMTGAVDRVSVSSDGREADHGHGGGASVACGPK